MTHIKKIGIGILCFIMHSVATPLYANLSDAQIRARMQEIESMAIRFEPYEAESHKFGLSNKSLKTSGREIREKIIFYNKELKEIGIWMKEIEDILNKLGNTPDKQTLRKEVLKVKDDLFGKEWDVENLIENLNWRKEARTLKNRCKKVHDQCMRYLTKKLSVPENDPNFALRLLQMKMKVHGGLGLGLGLGLGAMGYILFKKYTKASELQKIEDDQVSDKKKTLLEDSE